VGLVVTGRRLSERFRPDESSAVSRIAIHSSDALRRVIEIEELRSNASRDSVTGLDNKTRFLDDLAEAVERATRYKQPLALIMIDTDGQKAANEKRDPSFDKRLVLTANTLRAEIRSSDHPARIGYTEFAVICPMTGGEEATAIANRVKQAIINAEGNSSGDVPSIGVGIAIFPEDSDKSTSLYAAAEQDLERRRATLLKQLHVPR
jgi:diguanylate cyclase (GGDEF)-like protein